MNKVVVIGLDGASWKVLDPMIADGELKNFARLKEKMSWGYLDSTVPPLTPPGWTTSVTGKNPGKHNIFDFFKYSSSDYDIHLTNRTDRKARAIWNYVSEAGGKVLVMNVPHTYPPEEVNGSMITGFGTPEWNCEYTYPPELKSEILKENPEFVVDLPSTLLHHGKFDKFLEQLNPHSKTHWEVFTKLYQEQQPDFAMYAFVEMDRLFHFFWKEFEENQSPMSEKFRNHITYIDGLIGEFLDKLSPETNVIMISDHGFGLVEKDIYINNWLLENGFINLREGCSATVQIPLSVKIKKCIISVLSTLGVWKFYVKWKLEKEQQNEQTTTSASAEVDVKTTWYLSKIDWPKTQAAFHSMACRGIRLNIKGRDAQGAVEPAEAKAVAIKIRDGLKTLVDPLTGEKIIKNAWLSSEVYKGDYLYNAADVYLEPVEKYSMHHGFADELTKPSMQHDYPRSGDHEQYGVFIASGNNIKGGEVKDISLADIAPTVLHLMGLTVSNQMDGKPIIPAIDDEWMEKNPVKIIAEDAYSDQKVDNNDDDDLLKDRLRDLGYL